MAIKYKPDHHYYHQKSGITVSMRAVNLDKDFSRLYEWAHQSHVIPNWKLNKTPADLFQHLNKALNDSHQSLLIVAVDGHEICYAETYYAPEDRLANFCEVEAGDYGLHLFIGPPEALGKGYSESILCALTDYLFTRHHAVRVLVEPNHQVKQLTILEHKLGFSNLGAIQLPEKTATLYAIDAPTFYKLHPPVSGPVSTHPSKIHCDTTEWPLVRIHFPDYPERTDVVHWLKECDDMLSRQGRCVIISTFSENYKFNAASRRYQALWFKRNVERLASRCMAMLRVTRDQKMIAKITSNAMRKGMPFICIPVNSVKEAEFIAKRLLKKRVSQSTELMYAAE